MPDPQFSEMPKGDVQEAPEYEAGKDADVIPIEELMKKGSESKRNVMEATRKSAAASAQTERERRAAGILRAQSIINTASTPEKVKPIDMRLPEPHTENPAGNMMTNSQLRREDSWLDKLLFRATGLNFRRGNRGGRRPE